MEISRLVSRSSGLIFVLGAFVLAVGACAHEKALSPEELASSEGPTRAAEEAGAQKIPAAALYLKLAHEEIAQAKVLGEKGDPRATSVLARAQADAELALAMAQEKSTEKDVKVLLDEAKTVKEQ